MQKQISWLRVVTEGVVIVVSILLAFGIDAWWERHQDRQDEVQALLDLRADLATDSADLANLQRRMGTWDDKAMWVDRNVGRDLEADSVETALRQLWFFSLYQPINASYSGLRDSGQLILLRNTELRRLIVDYYETRQPYVLQFEALVMPRYNRILRSSAEFVELGPRLEAGTMRAPRVQLFRPWSDLTRRSQFVIDVMDLGTMAAQAELRIGQVLEDVADLLEAVDVELNDVAS
jgi:hypothetical protein